jgi:hypothetical protein
MKMPYFRPKAMLAGSASADLFKNTLSRIPTVFGRLAYFASVRDPSTGAYNHHGLAALFGREESRRAMAEVHREVFQEWLNLGLASKRDDLMEYLLTVEDKASAVSYWRKAGMAPAHLPRTATEAERELFFREGAIVVETLTC